MPLVAIATHRTESSQLLWAAILILVAVLTAFYLPTRPLFVFRFVVGIVVCVFAVAVMRSGLALKASTVRANAARAGRPIIVALFDLDELNHLNDTEWHEVAGDVLARVAATSSSSSCQMPTSQLPEPC